MELKELRQALGLTQQQMAAKVGCGLRTWVRWELGEGKPMDVFQRKIDALKRDVKKRGNK